MNHKIIGILLILFSGIGYLEWGNQQSTFLFQAEIELFKKIFTDPISVMHPLTILPILGQILILFAIIKSPFSKKTMFIGIGFLSILLGFMLVIGCISGNPKIIISTLPFIGLSGFLIWKRGKI